MLHLAAATLGYRGQAVLQGVDLRVAAGERVVVLGPSGAGKTTLLNALYRLAGARAALIPQPHGLVGPLTAAHNIALGRIDQRPLWRNLRSLIAMPAAERRAIAESAAPLDLGPQLDQSVQSLSGGQQSRVAIARALYRGGDCLLADEPCAALDPERARAALTALCERFATIVCTMHDVEAGLALATRVIGVSRGGIGFDLAPAAVTGSLLDGLYGPEARSAERAGPARSAAAPEVVMAPRGCL